MQASGWNLHRLALAGACLALFACGSPSPEVSVDAPREGDASDAPTAVEAKRTVTAAKVTVSGVSSGAHMAVQAHVALADRVSGVAALAGGPWHCAEGSLANAGGRCLSGEGVDVPGLLAFAYELSASGDIAPVNALAGARVWILHSPEDRVVAPVLSDALAAFYSGFVHATHIARVGDVPAAHGWPTLATGAPCATPGADFMNACDYDAAGALLAYLYGELEPRAGDVGAPGRVDLSVHFDAGSGVAPEAFVFMPASCADDPGACRLHIAFHGCRMGEQFVGDRFARGAGLNEWAANNGIVVVYPQVDRSTLNPQGCWDWWGYTGFDYARRSGKQVAGVARMLDAFARGELRPR